MHNCTHVRTHAHLSWVIRRHTGTHSPPIIAVCVTDVDGRPPCALDVCAQVEGGAGQEHGNPHLTGGGARRGQQHEEQEGEEEEVGAPEPEQEQEPEFPLTETVDLGTQALQQRQEDINAKVVYCV